MALPPAAVPIPAAAAEIASETVVKQERRDDEPEEEENQSERDAPSKGLATSMTDDRRKKARTEHEGCDFFLVSSLPAPLSCT